MAGAAESGAARPGPARPGPGADSIPLGMCAGMASCSRRPRFIED